MPICTCGGHSVRVRRRFWQRPFYRAVYRCEECGRTASKPNAPSLFTTKSLCPKCGTGNLKIRKKRDTVDSMSGSLLSRIQGVLGAEIHHCEFCRFQFYDFREVPEPRLSRRQREERRQEEQDTPA